MIKKLLCCLLFCCGQVSASAGEMSGVDPLALLPALALSTQDTPATIALGKKLFFDPTLSGNNQISCATCHDPLHGWGDAKVRSIGIRAAKLARHTPSLFNTAHQTRWFWDGRASSLEEQSLSPIQSKDEMGQNLNDLIQELGSKPAYPAMFEAAFGNAEINISALGAALVAFERTILSSQSDFDAYLQGDQQAMSGSAKRGLALFEGKARCILCHQGSNFSDRGFHNIGLKTKEGETDDLGHFAVIPIKSQKGSFKTPTLRSVARHPPYMHHGGLESLQAVVAFYNRGGDVAENRDPQIQPLFMTLDEQNDLIAFLHALTSPVLMH